MRDMQETRELLAWCKSCPFFETLSDFTCAEVCEKLNTMHFSVGDTLLNEGEVGDKMYIILKGVVGIYSSILPECIDEVGSNNIIGEMALRIEYPSECHCYGPRAGAGTAAEKG